MQEHYKGNFEVLPYKTSVGTPPYNDTSKYKYILVLWNAFSKEDFESGIKKPVWVRQFPHDWHSENYILDRINNIEYPSNIEDDNMMKNIEFYADKLSESKK